MLSDLRFGQKMALTLSIIGILFCWVIYQYDATLDDASAGYRQLLDVAEQRKSLSQNIDRLMLQARRSEKDFLMRKKEKYPERVAGLVLSIREKTDALLALESAANAEEGADKARKIRAAIDDYHKAFGAIVTAWKARGLDHKSGLQGRFRKAVHDLESLAHNFETGDLYITLLQIRRGEKDLGLRRQEKYVAKVAGLVGTAKAQIDESKLSDALKARFIAGVETYHDAFKTYAAGILAGDENQGGKGAFRDAAHAIEALIKAHYVEDLGKNILMLRRREKDFLLRGDSKYVGKAQKEIATIQESIFQSGVAEADKKALLRLLGSYQDDFMALAGAHEKIGSLIAVMRESVHKIEPIIADNLVKAEQQMTRIAGETDDRARHQAAIALIFGVVAIALGAVMGTLLTQTISRSAKTIARETGELEREMDLTRRLSLRGKDEMGSIAASVNAFVAKLFSLSWSILYQSRSIEAAAQGLERTKVSLHDNT